jgi:hypothetical protein
MTKIFTYLILINLNTIGLIQAYFFNQLVYKNNKYINKFFLSFLWKRTNKFTMKLEFNNYFLNL